MKGRLSIIAFAAGIITTAAAYGLWTHSPKTKIVF